MISQVDYGIFVYLLFLTIVVVFHDLEIDRLYKLELSKKKSGEGT